MSSLYDMVKTQVAFSPGVGPITPSAALPGYTDFSIVPNNTLISYGVGDQISNGVYTEWEVGHGTFAGGVLSRGPIRSSNGGLLVNFIGATANVWIPVLAEDLVTIANNYAYTQPTSGSTVVMAINTTAQLLDPAAEIATLTVTLPGVPGDGQVVEISSTQIIDALTVNASGATVIGGGPMILSANGGVSWRYRASNTTWYRRY